MRLIQCSEESVAMKKDFFMISETTLFFFFWSHIARLGDEALVIVIDCQELNLHT